MAFVRRTGTKTSRGRFKTTRKYTHNTVVERREFVQRKGESQSSVAKRADEWLAANKGRHQNPLKSLAQCIDLYLEHREGADLAPKTRRDDRYAASIVKALLGSRPVEQIDATDVERALRLYKGKPRTAKKARDFGGRVLKFLKKRRLTQENPFLEADPIPYSPKRFEEPMDPADFDKAAALVDGPVRTLLLLLRYTGIRPTAGKDLMWPEVSQGRRMFIRKASNKNEAGTRGMPVPEKVAALIRAIPKTSVFVFPSKRTGKPWSYSHVDKTWRSAQRKAGVEVRGLYALKHLRVTELRDRLKDDVKVAAAVGISSPQVIGQSYAQIDRQKLHEDVDEKA